MDGKSSGDAARRDRSGSSAMVESGASEQDHVGTRAELGHRHDCAECQQFESGVHLPDFAAMM
ncbi:MAG: hypothetical protein RI957_1681 [Verrucomicrobiota bacterium]